MALLAEDPTEHNGCASAHLRGSGTDASRIGESNRGGGYGSVRPCQNNNNNNNNGGAASGAVALASVRDVVGHLQETCQLPPDTQIVPTDRKIPAQEWRRATPDDMVPGTGGGGVDLVEFAAILRTKSVCAWGECYTRLKPGASEFETETAAAVAAAEGAPGASG
mmetsp:Transcript_9740/g.22193  ORF Transcript_9740/g.22193 Transcript_9740/m.22193 type:complete len:165 (+) Transcript_9740:257-751(+)